MTEAFPSVLTFMESHLQVTGPLADVHAISLGGVDVQQRIVYLDELDEDTGTWFVKVLNFLQGQDDQRPVRVVISSPGGDITSEFTIHDAIRAAKVPIETFGTGQVCSAGVLLLTCGHRRLVTESCVLMAHEPTSDDGAELGLRAARQRRKWTDWTLTHWASLMARYTPNKDAKAWERIVEKNAEYWLLGGKAIVEAGLADEVVGV